MTRKRHKTRLNVWRLDLHLQRWCGRVAVFDAPRRTLACCERNQRYRCPPARISASRSAGAAGCRGVQRYFAHVGGSHAEPARNSVAVQGVQVVSGMYGIGITWQRGGRFEAGAEVTTGAASVQLPAHCLRQLPAGYSFRDAVQNPVPVATWWL